MGKGILTLLIAFLASLGVLVVLFSKNFRSLNTLVDYSNAVDHTHKVLQELLVLENYLKDAETGAHGYLLTNDTAFLRPLVQIRDDIESGFANLRNLVADNPYQQRNLDTLRLVMQERIDLLDEELRLYRMKVPVRRSMLNTGNQLMQRCRALFDRMGGEEDRLLARRSRLKDMLEARTLSYPLVLAMVVVAILMVSMVFIIREFVRRVRYQRNLEQKIIELDQATTELEQITFVTSHDLQEPLRKIRTFGDLLESRHSAKLPAELLNLVKRIGQSAVHMQELVQDLMRLTSMGVQREPLVAVDLHQIVTKAAADRRADLASNDVELTIDGTLPSVMGAGKNLMVLFDCLIDNSIKFSKSGRRGRISITSWPVDDAFMNRNFGVGHSAARWHKVSVHDNGIGFEPIYHERVFKLFQRLHSRDGEYQGKGIGLALARRVMTNHGGFIDADAILNEGTTINLYFPLA